MKKMIAIALMVVACIAARAQVVIVNDNLMGGRLCEISATVLDSLSKEPVPFASVYVIPSKDTTITNFTLSDAEGVAKLPEVPYGSYVFRVEMMGYKPFVRERYFRDWRVDMGEIKLKPDENFLAAAVVSDVGNPIVIKQDTVEFNASSFRVGANAMLKDLIKRMPGMEITEDGKVKFNGTEIDKLTVGGRTFFFGDQSMALNNLPASVVDKIRVIDRDSEQSRATGVSDGTREKVLDVALKKEYEKGWFGNAGARAGATVPGEDSEDDPLRQDGELLYNANALVSAYTEKDQLTLIGSAQNVDDSGMVIMVVSDDGGRVSNLGQGLTTAAQLGVNANTTRIKDVETTVGASWKYTDVQSGGRSSRTTFQEDGDIASVNEKSARQFADTFSANMEFKKETGKVWFHLRPSFTYSESDSFSEEATRADRAETMLNTSRSSYSSGDVNRNAGANSDITFRELWGKKSRSLMFSLSGRYSDGRGSSGENTVFTSAAGSENRMMDYVTANGSRSLDGGIRYTEPLGTKLTLTANANITYSTGSNTRDASDAAGHNDYYSSESDTRYVHQVYGLSAQYKMNATTRLTLGGNMHGVLNETYSKSFGISATTGEGEWMKYFSPNARIIYNKESTSASFNLSGSNQRPAATSMLPVLNVSNPSRISMGNIYLKPHSLINFGGYWSNNDRKRFTNMMLYLYANIDTSPVTYARWYDASGILYSVPVNVSRPSVAASLTANYTTPLDSKKLLSLNLGAGTGFSSSASYQPSGALAGLDRNAFDYGAFMSSFWGDASGDRFYGGQSGFNRSVTNSFTPYLSTTLKYNPERWYVEAVASLTGRISAYSLDPSLNMNTLDTRLGVSGSWTSKHEYEFETDLSYTFYTGYPEGYDDPEFSWDASVTKALGAFNLSLKLHDILDQTRSRSHVVAANYVEDSYRLVLGRYLLFGVKWNFGKMNAAHSRRAERAAWNMAF